MSLRRRLLYSLSILLCICGVALFAYPFVASRASNKDAGQSIEVYESIVQNSQSSFLDLLLDRAQRYNSLLQYKTSRFVLSDVELEEYNRLLDVAGTGILGYVNIPKCNISLPIYHGVDDSVLQKAIGHVPGSSMPVEGKGVHSILCGHSGLETATLFDDLDRVQYGDIFYITVLGKKLTYIVDQIEIVLPSELDSLIIDSDKNYVTLMTCTPYGVNTHRLLVRGVLTSEVQEETTV